MPVVWSADEHCVDVFPFEEFAEIDVGVAAFVLARLFVGGVTLLDKTLAWFSPSDSAIPVARAFAIDVAHRHDLNARIAQEPTHIVEALIACSDDAKVDAVARCRPFVQPKSGGRHNHWRNQPRGLS